MFHRSRRSQRPPAEPLLLLAADELQLRAAEPLPADHVALLAHDAPALKGHFATRHRYVDDQHRTALFNSIGEARASITAADDAPPVN
ncbi:hypothetical protein [Cryptosporangium sp. NPDC051539]|uniref:hypothetical protein n=1 Tax=Cryptosporangium sp. NPDC051539 TaxID=3363962 RepID=UPI0037A6BD1D